MTKRTVAVVYNPVKVELDDLKAAVAAEPQSADCEVLWFATSEEDPGRGPAQEALDAGATIVIAAGGDGTVRAVAEVVRGSDAALALLPSGTGNLLARNLSLTLNNVADSLHAAFGKGERDIDVADIEIMRPDRSVENLMFLVMAGAGLDAKIMSNTDDELKKKVGWVAYAQALSKVMKDKDSLRLTYKVDNRRNRTERAQTIVIGNCGSLPANILLLPDAVVDDGLLDVIVVKPESIRGWLAVTFKIFWENGVVRRTRIGQRLTMMKSASLDMRQAKTIVVKLSKPEIVELDGDPFGEMVGCRVSVDPLALTVKVPV
jgi:diacylglycerol kinase (ATP)